MKKTKKIYFFGLYERGEDGKIYGTKGSTLPLSIIYLLIGSLLSVIVRYLLS